MPHESSSPVVGDGIVHATSLTLQNVFFIPKFPNSLLSIRQLNKNSNYCDILSIIVFCDLHTGMSIGTNREKGDMYYMDEEITHADIFVLF